MAQARLIKTRDGWEIHIGNLTYDITAQMEGFIEAEMNVRLEPVRNDLLEKLGKLAKLGDDFSHICAICAPYNQMTAEQFAKASYPNGMG
jgi:hypothetical protein